MTDKHLARLLRLAKITLVFVYLVILAGAVVRATGSGMGCPDWPRCFGQWIPPTDESQLPPGYREIYKTAEYEAVEFNVYKTWTEYLNRLLGAVLGIFCVIVFVFSLKFRKKDIWSVYLSLLGAASVGFQGWLGSVVVSSNLEPVKVTAHMIMALAILALYTFFIARLEKVCGSFCEMKIPGGIRNLLLVSLLLTVIQIIIGTQVREEVDVLMKDLSRHKEVWPALLGSSFDIHRGAAVIFLLFNTYLLYGFLKKVSSIEAKNYFKVIFLLLILQLSVGFILGGFGMPSFAQPLHLFFAMVIFGKLVSLILRSCAEKHQ